jgi:hypothetical protein
MQGDDLTIFLFFMGLTVAFGLEAVKAETTARRVGFGVLAGACLLTGALWLQIKEVSPRIVTDAISSVATNPLAWFVVLMFIVAVFAFHRPKKREQRTTARAPISSAAPSTDPSTDPAERVTIDVTPEHLMGLYEGRTAVQADRLASAFIDKWMLISGPLRNISTAMSYKILVTVDPPTKQHCHIFLLFDPQWATRLESMLRGQTMHARGRITEIALTFVQLEDCELMQDRNTQAPH